MAIATVAAIAAMAVAACGGARTKAADPAGPPVLALCPDRACVAVEGLPPPVVARLRAADEAALARRALAVYVAPAGGIEAETAADTAHDTDATPMLGRHELGEDDGGDGRLTFHPRFGFAAGVAYRAVFEPGALGLADDNSADAGTRTLRFTVPSPHREAPRLLSASPPGPAVPANLLRIYLQFDRPMDPRGASEHVRLLDRAEAPIRLAFAPVPEGLWDADTSRATLLIHPGRIKRGVAPGEAMGPVLAPGARVTLEVDGAWRDAWGTPLGRPWRTAYTVGPADRGPIDPRRWRLSRPAAGSREALAIAFDEPLDGVLARRWIAVHRADGPLVAGEVSVGADGRSWRLEPDRPWPPERHVVRIDRRLEDLAGNTVLALFDREETSRSVSGSPSDESDSPAFELPFRPRQRP